MAETSKWDLPVLVLVLLVGLAALLAKLVGTWVLLPLAIPLYLGQLLMATAIIFATPCPPVARRLRRAAWHGDACRFGRRLTRHDLDEGRYVGALRLITAGG